MVWCLVGEEKRTFGNATWLTFPCARTVEGGIDSVRRIWLAAVSFPPSKIARNVKPVSYDTLTTCMEPGCDGRGTRDLVSGSARLYQLFDSSCSAFFFSSFVTLSSDCSWVRSRVSMLQSQTKLYFLCLCLPYVTSLLSCFGSSLWWTEVSS